MVAASKIKLLGIVGPTASGKTGLALNIASLYDGEIIAADSRTVYKRMDIGTAKPSAGEQNLVPHHLLDIASVDEPLTAAQFKKLADEKIAEIQKRGKLPILVGGSGLYVDAVLFGFSFAAKADISERKRLNNLTVEQLHRELANRSIDLPVNSKNKRHLVRTLETDGIKSQDRELRKGTAIIGLKPSREDLKERIAQRVEAMITAGLEQEAYELFEAYGRHNEALNTIGYKEWLDYFDGHKSLEQVKEEIIKNTQAYAKRQLTWFKRNKFIQWFESPETALVSVKSTLNN